MSLEIRGPAVSGSEKVLTPDALQFLERLVREYRPPHSQLLGLRRIGHRLIKDGDAALLHTMSSAHIREDDWKVAPLPAEFWETGIELTGPAGNRNMVYRALTSGAVRYMADSEDSESPFWRNILNGQINLMDAVRETITYRDKKTGAETPLSGKLSKLMYRPRGLHLPEPRVLVDGTPIPAALFDAGMFLFHNATELVARGRAVHLYLPKRETYHEARFDNEMLLWIEDELGLEPHIVKTTYLNENLRATFEAHEIMYVTQYRFAGFNVGRYDEMASMERMLFRQLFPERRQVTMAVPLLDGYVDAVGQACYLHGAPFYGGMEAQIPVNDNPEFSTAALAKATAGKMREANEKGCVRAWVAHPGMVQSMQALFQNRPADWYEKAKARYAAMAPIPREQLTTAPVGTISEEGLAEQTDACLIYLANWYSGTGAVGIRYYTLDGTLSAVIMDDLATVEQARTQETKSLLLGAKLDDGRLIDRQFLEAHIATRTADILGRVSPEVAANIPLAVQTLHELLDCTKATFPEYLTDVALPKLIALEDREA